MQEILAKFTAIMENPYEAIAKEKSSQDRKIIGCAPMHFPEEMVQAAGALPVVLQESTEPVTTGYSYIYPFYCGFVRSLLDMAAKGKLGFMDGLIVPDTCLQMRGAFGVIKASFPFPYLEFVHLPPYLKDAGVVEEVRDSFQRCKKGLEQYTGQKLQQRSLREAIRLYNQNHALLKRLYDLRRAKPGLLRAKEMMAIVMSSMVMPKAEHNRLLGELLLHLEKRTGTQDSRVKVVVSGHMCQAPKPDLLDMIEEQGAVIVDDDLYTGYRYFAPDAPTKGDPGEALVKKYVDLSPPCPTRSIPARGEDDWGEYLVRMTRRAEAQGVVVLLVKFCEPHMMYYPHLRDALEAADIPHLLIETEHEVVSLSGVKTRIQAFVEMLRERGKK